MSKILALMATYTQTGAKIRRTIEHSPDFGGDESTDNDDSPSGRIPPGGMLTG